MEYMGRAFIGWSSSSTWDSKLAHRCFRNPNSNSSHVFTPQVCKAKYEDLKERYASCTRTWFEELRQKRVAELKRALELSENSIGVLESRIKSLEAAETDKKERHDPNHCTEETTYYCSANIAQLRWSKNMKKTRGKRKRRDHTRNHTSSFPNIKSSSLTLDHEFLSSDISSYDDHVVEEEEDHHQSSSNDQVEYLLAILESIMQNKEASVFRHRLYTQRRRYEKMIRRHVDLESIRYRIITRTLNSRMQLFVDLLVLANNALVFFPETSREYKSALIFRDLVTLQLVDLQHYDDDDDDDDGNIKKKNASPRSVIIRAGNI